MSEYKKVTADEAKVFVRAFRHSPEIVSSWLRIIKEVDNIGMSTPINFIIQFILKGYTFEQAVLLADQELKKLVSIRIVKNNKL